MTGLYLTSAAADAGVTAGSGTKWKAGWAPGGSAVHLNKNSVAGPTAPLQMTDGATAGTDGTAVSWYTEPLWGVTIAGAISCLFWDRENATANNVAPTMRIERCDGAGNVLSTIVAETTSQGSSEMATTAGGASDAMNVTAGNTTDTTLSDGDRLRITLWIDDAAEQGGTGNMAAGGRGEFWINGPNGAQGQAQLLFTEIVAPQAGPKILPFETANWTATTTPRTITAVGALSADLMVAMYGGDNFGSQVTAATASTTGGTTGAWTEIAENFGPSSNSAWKSNAWANVTADGDVTASLARTQGSPQVWGGWAALLKNHGGIGNTAELTNGATETVSLTTSANSIVLALGIDWDDLTNVAMVPAGAHDVERVSGTAVAWYAAFWVGQAAGTRNYGIATSSTANFVITLIEILAPIGAAMNFGAAAGSGAAQALSLAKDESFGTAAGSGAAQSLGLTKVPALGPATGTGTAQALATSKAVTLDVATGTGTPQPMSFTKAPVLGPATGSGAAQPAGFTSALTMALDTATGTGTPQPMSFTKALALDVASGSGAPAAIVASKSLAMGTAADAGSPQALALSKALGLQNAAGTGAAQAAGFTAAGSMPFGTATGVGTPQPMSFSKALALSPVTGSGAVQPLAFSKGLELGPAAGSGSVLELSSSKLLTFDFVAGAGTSYPMIFAPLVGPIDDDLGPWLTLGDLMDARATHEQIMLDVISVRHPGMIEGAFDPDLGYAPATQKPSYYTGKATVQARQISAGVLNPAGGLGTLTQLGYAVHGPVGSTFDQVAPGDIIVVTDSADPLHAGREIVVKNVESSSFVTARRVVCVDYQPSTP